MKLLLDTHAFLYAIADPERLSPAARKAVADPGLPRWVSAVSLWEIAIKVQLGKLDLPVTQAFYQEHIRRLRANVLAVEARHSFELFRLPLHHKDPFDRLLVAQARTDGMTLVTQDASIARYAVATLW
jgi:PIN domain nuclease of toxin-antitoxin system